MLVQSKGTKDSVNIKNIKFKRVIHSFMLISLINIHQVCPKFSLCERHISCCSTKMMEIDPVVTAKICKINI